MKKLLAIGLILSLTIVFAGCDIEQSAEQKQEEATNQALNQMNNAVGMPNIKEFYEKKLAKEIYEMRDNSKLICHAYTQSLNGKFVYLGKCIGYGLPYSVQYTNPEKIEYSATTLPQADPNGLYMPSGLSATWVMLVNEKGEREILYCESNVIVNQSKLPRRLVESWSLTDNY